MLTISQKPIIPMPPKKPAVPLKVAKEQNLLRAYQQEIGRYPLLKGEEEISLAKRIQAGDPEAKIQFIQSNLRLVVYIVFRYYRDYNVPLMDLIQEGTLGLIRAVEKFVPKEGRKFSTYAFLWIKQAISKEINLQAHTIYEPVNNLYLLQRCIRELEEKLRREPTEEELSIYSGFSLEKVRSSLVRRNDLHPVSLDNFLASPFQSPEAILLENDLRRVFEEAIASLTEKEEFVIRWHFGLNENEICLTLKEIGEKLFEVGLSKRIITREAVRQIKENAFKKLLRCARRLHLQDYLEINLSKQQPGCFRS